MFIFTKFLTKFIACLRLPCCFLLAALSCSAAAAQLLPHNAALFYEPVNINDHNTKKSDIPSEEFAEPPLTEGDIFPHIAPPDKSKTTKNSRDQNNIPPLLPNDNSLSGAQKRKKEQDKLFQQLKSAADFDKAAEISRSIEGLWAQSGSDSVDLLMFWANKEIAEKNYAIALDFLDNAVSFAPNYAEGWMRRASIHLITNDIAQAMAEMQRVLQLEPRHYNAMLQLGAVMELTNRPEQALKAYEKALEFYPQMRSAQRRIQVLTEKSGSRAI